MAGLAKEIWIKQFLDSYRQNLGWLAGITEDMSELVDNDAINLAEAGVDPDVLINNTAYPISINEQADTPHRLPLNNYDTTNTVVRNAQQKELSYAKLEMVIKKHRKAMIQAQAGHGAHSIAPLSNSAFTPVVSATGDGVSGISGVAGTVRMPSEDDIFSLSEVFDDIDAPEEGRNLVLHKKHWNHLVKNSATLKEQRYRMELGTIKRTFLNLAGFTIWKYSGPIVYNRTTLAKAAYGAAPAATDTIASFAFMGDEVMKAMGTLDFFSRLDDPEARGDIVGYQQRALILPKRNKYTASLVSPEV